MFYNIYGIMGLVIVVDLTHFRVYISIFPCCWQGYGSTLERDPLCSKVSYCITASTMPIFIHCSSLPPRLSLHNRNLLNKIHNTKHQSSKHTTTRRSVQMGSSVLVTHYRPAKHTMKSPHYIARIFFASSTNHPLGAYHIVHSPPGFLTIFLTHPLGA